MIDDPDFETYMLETERVRSKTISEVMELDPVLPGESAKEYQSGLYELLYELKAKTPMQVYLGEKIYSCIWWIRRYEQQKRDSILFQMAKQLKTVTIGNTLEKDQKIFLEFTIQNIINQQVQDIVKQSGHSFASLQQKAMSVIADNLKQLDEQIALQNKILAGLQVSFEIAASRKLNLERLEIQNKLLKQDLKVIEDQSDGNTKANKR